MKIAFGITSGSGKDTSVDYLIKTYGGIKYSFAKPLYDMMYFSQTTLGIPQKKDRKFLQMFGDFFRSEVCEDVFIDFCLQNIEDEKNCYISDLRFQNEFLKLKRSGFTCVKLTRHADNSARIDNGNQHHISETSLQTMEDSEWDYIIDNNGTLEDLYRQLNCIVLNQVKEE
jgi:hypothetical protein